MRNKFVIFVALVLSLGSLVTVGLLFSMDADELDTYYARYNKQLQDFDKVSVTVTVQQVESAANRENESNPPVPGERPSQSVNPDPVNPTPNPSEPPNLTGEHILDVPYIQQGDPRWTAWARGNYSQKDSHLGRNGCIDCSYTMAAMYLGTCSEVTDYNGTTGVCLDDQAHSLKHTVQAKFYSGTSFLKDPYCSAHGLKTTGDNKAPNTQAYMDILKDYIDKGFPVVIHIKGTWHGQETGKELHKSTNDHFLLVIGYTDNGIVVNDPGPATGDHREIAYGDWTNCPWRGYRPVTK